MLGDSRFQDLEQQEKERLDVQNAVSASFLPTFNIVLPAM
jgi:hypothetical protein